MLIYTLQDVSYKNPMNYGARVNMGSCRIFTITSRIPILGCQGAEQQPKMAKALRRTLAPWQR